MHLNISSLKVFVFMTMILQTVVSTPTPTSTPDMEHSDGAKPGPLLWLFGNRNSDHNDGSSTGYSHQDSSPL
ncbi:hypothetical protein C8J56DRAFT_1033626 [Mycena floridula]|nr:hypothetical protein C8J56DRAFT_1173807 [Mycena floridula]KAJ7573795.1 hypothetical protein C8J56DRAFT_1033626 [Mycena floridula]